MNQMVENIKQIHNKDMCLFRMGGFYHTYDKDSYILSYFFGYKVRDLGNNTTECGFPVDCIGKILKKLEDNRINYVILDRRNNYDVEERTNYKNLNRYDKFAVKAKSYVNCKKRIDNISKYLTENIYDENTKNIISNIEKYLRNEKEKKSKR